MLRARPLMIFIALTAFSGSAQAGDTNPDVVIKNRIGACVTIEAKKTSTNANLVLLDVTITVKKSSGECGCMSASATYTSSILHGDSREILQQGQIRVLQGGAQKLVLTSDAAVVNGRQVILEIGCTPPL